MAKRARPTREAAEDVAIQALGVLAGDPERLGRFLALSGLGPDTIRSAAGDPQFLAGVLDYVEGDEGLLLDVARALGVEPAEVSQARIVLTGAAWEREVP
jgi:hypothetical protein